MLSYLHTNSSEGKKYIAAMGAAANFAFTNRHIMALLVRRCFNHMFGPTPLKLVYDVTHNMAKLEEHGRAKLWVHRKGATRAFGPRRMAGTIFEQTGQPIITPGSMGTASFLLVGTGNSEESLCSVNHGAGRIMSRTAARGDRWRRPHHRTAERTRRAARPRDRPFDTRPMVAIRRKNPVRITRKAPSSSSPVPLSSSEPSEAESAPATL